MDLIDRLSDAVEDAVLALRGAPMDSADAMKRLAEAADGLLFSSESDYPLEPFVWDRPEPFAPALLHELAGLPADAPVQQVSLDDFFAPMLSTASGTPQARKRASRTRRLLKTLRATLRDITVYKLGSVEMPAFVVGTREDGAVAGLRTTVVES